MIKKLEKQIKKDFGPRCKTRAYLCPCCLAYLALDILKELYDLNNNGKYKI
jgi:hypothetical protein